MNDGYFKELTNSVSEIQDKLNTICLFLLDDHGLFVEEIRKETEDAFLISANILSQARKEVSVSGY